MIYLTFIGTHDNISPDSIHGGAVCTIFRENMEKISKIYLLSTGKDFREIAEKNKRLISADKKEVEISIIDVEIVSPIDYDSIFQVMHYEIINIISNNSKDEYIINITSGTPAMTACWILLSKSGLIPNSTLIQSFDPKFSKQLGKNTQIVDLEIDNFPEISSPDEIKSKLNKISADFKVIKEKHDVQEISQKFQNLIGSSLAMQQLKKDILQYAIASKSSLNIMILGPTGTGKELVAKEIVEKSTRANKPFKTVNLAGMDTNLIDSELFGHIKGSFTSAIKDRQGIFKSVDGGTLFIDEIGDLPYSIQTKLLKTIEYGDIQPLGSDNIQKVDVRVIGATNKNLNDLIEKNEFRQDFLFRFPIQINVPPLSDRVDDIPELVNYFIKKTDTNIRLSSKCIELLKKENWPGNVRQLSHVIVLASTLNKEKPLEIEDISRFIKQFDTNKKFSNQLLPPLPFNNEATLNSVLDNIRTHYENQAMLRHNDNAAKAAKEDLNIPPHTLRKRLKSRK